MLRTLIQIVLVLMVVAAAPLRAVDPTIAFAVTSNGQPVSEGQTVSGVVNITVTVTNGVDMHVATYGNMIFLPFNEPGHRADTPVWSHTTQVDTRRFYDGDNLLSVHVHPHNQPGQPYIADFTFGTFKIVSENSNPAPNGDRLLPTLSISAGWTPTVELGEYYLTGNASVVDDKTSSGVGTSQTTAAPVQIIAHLGESVLGRFRWNTQTPPFGDFQLVSRCHLRPFQLDHVFTTKVVFFFTDGAGRANYATRAFNMPALPTTAGVDLPQPLLDAKIVGLGDGGTLRVPDGGTTPLYVQVSNLASGGFTYPEMTTWIGNRAVKVTNLLPYLRSLSAGATSVIVEVLIPADEVQRLQAARQGGEMSSATPIWVDFNQGNVPCLPVSSHIHLNSVRTTSYPWPYGEPTVVIRKPWNNSGHWTGTTLVARYDQWGPLPVGYQVRWRLNTGAWQVDDGDGLISLSGLTRQSHRLEIELTDAALVRLPGTSSFAAANFTVITAAPVAVADVFTVVKNGTLNATGGVLVNDQDSDGDPITAVLASQARHGTVILANDGSFSYVPSPGFIGFDRFSYRASDGSLSSAETDVRIQVTAGTGGARVLGDWPMLGRDAEHSGYMGGYLGSAAPTLSWTASFSPGNNSYNSMKGSAVVGGRVVTSTAYSMDQIRVACFNASTGQREWESLLNQGDISGPTIGNGLAYVQHNNGANSKMIAFDLSSGAVRWSTPYADQWGADWAPTVADGSVWVQGGTYGGLYGYDALTGAQRFFQALPQFEYWTPAYRGGKVFTWMQGAVRRHDALTGAVELSKALKAASSTSGSANTMPVLAEDRLVLRDDQLLNVVDPTDFSLRWQRMPLVGWWVQTPVVHDGIVYALTNNNSLEILDLANGRQLGVVTLPGSPSSAPIVTDDAIIVSCDTGYPYTGVTLVIDRASLSVRYTLPRGGSLALAGNALYITDNRNNLSSPSVRRYVFNSDVPTVTWTTESQSSTNESGTMTVTAQLSAASGQIVILPFEVSGTASASDYMITASPITIPAGATTGTATITIGEDTLNEANETVVLHMGTPTNAMFVATIVHTASIANDDAAPTVTWTTANQSSANESGTLTVTAQLSAASGQNHSIPFTVTGTATGSDYTITASPITIPAGATTATVTIAITADTLNEADETMILTMGAPLTATLGATTVHTATITNDDAVPTIAWTVANQSSANESGTLTISAQLSAASGHPVTVPFSVTGTATSGSDYVMPETSPLIIPAGTTTGTVRVIIAADSNVEENETVVLTMGTPTNATAGATTVHTATISNLAPVNAVEPSIIITVTSNGQPVNEGQTVSGVANITVTVINGIDNHVAAYGNMLFLSFNEPGHRANAPVWSHTTQVDTRRFYDGENLLSVHVHPHNQPGQTYSALFTFETFRLISENNNPAPNGDRLLPTLSIDSGWTPQSFYDGEYYLSGDASVVDDKSSSGVGRQQFTAAPVQIIAHLGESVLGRMRWNTLTPPFGDGQLVSQCYLRPFQRDQAFNAKVVFFFTDGAGRANYATRAFSMPSLPATGINLPQPMLDAKILGIGDGDTLRVPDGGTAPLYVQVNNLTPGVLAFPQMTTWIGNRAVKVTNLLPYIQDLPVGATSVIVEVPIPADEVQRLQEARQGGEMSSAIPIWVDFIREGLPCLPVSSHIHLNSVRTTSYPWPYGEPTVVIKKPWNNSGHWTGTTLVARYDQWGPLPSGYRVRWKLNSGTWQVDDGDGLISLSGLTRQSHVLEVELTDAALVRLPGANSFAAVNFTVTDTAPVAVADVYAVVTNNTLNVTASGVLLNDQDSDGDLITAVLASQPRHGTVSLAGNGSFTYFPAPGFVGFDRFSYRATDGILLSEETDVRIQITAPTIGASVLGDWPMLGRDANHAGHISGYLGNVAPTLSWTVSFPPGTSTVNRIEGIAVVGGRVVTSVGYYAYNQIRVACFNSITGQREWETLFNPGDVSTPAIGNGQVYVQRANQGDSQVIALDLLSGAVRWSTPFSNQSGTGWPTVADGSLWVHGGFSGGLYGYDAITGTQRFFQPIGQYNKWTPAYRNGKLFTWIHGTIRQHDALTGVVEFSKVLKPTNNPNSHIWSMPVLVDDQLVLFGAEQLMVVDTADFSVRWHRMPAAGAWGRAPVVHDGIIYALAGSALEALDLVSGRQLGVVALPSPPASSPIVTDDAIIVSCNTGNSDAGVTVVIDLASLSIRYTLLHGGPIVLSDNALYIADGSANIASPSIRRYAFPVAPTNNQPPVAIDDAFSTPEDTALTISAAALLANDSDADGNPLSVQIVSQPANGTLTAITGGYSFVPVLNWFGTTSFTYVANDGQANSQSATVTISVTPVDDLPVVNAGPDQVVPLVGTPAMAGWSFAPWTGDADSGISSTSSYTAKHSFGNNRTSATVNGVTFSEGNVASGTGWSIGGAIAYWNGNDDAAVTGGSELLAQEFVYNGKPRTVTFTGLTIGQTYEASFFSVAWETGSRTQTFSTPGVTSVNINQDHYNNNKGIRITCVYTATSATQVMTITPLSGNTFHLYALANKVLPASSSATVNLTGTASDPNSDPLTLAWTSVSGPAPVTFGNASTAVTTATFTASGVYTLRLTANDGFGPVADDVVITVTDGSTPIVAWTTASQVSADESGTLTVTAQLSTVSAQSVSVPFTLIGTATGADYSITASPITIAPGATIGTATITITADTLDETDENVILTMGIPTNATAGATTVHTAAITDDDPAPTVEWTVASQSSVDESGTLTVTAQLSAASGHSVTVPFTVTGTATVESDYTITASPITIAAGATTGTAMITIVADGTVEGDETVILTMGTPTNATAGATTVHMTTITESLPPTITTQPANQTVIAGQTATFTVVASGNPAPSYQWQKNGVIIAGATSATYVTPVTVNADDGILYSCVVSNVAGSITSASANLKVIPLGLIARWKGDAGSGTTLTDDVGTRHGTLINATWAEGRVGNAVSFNGTNGYVNVPTPSLALSNQVSISLWSFGGTALPKATSVLWAKDASGNRVLNIHLPWSNGAIYWDAGNVGTSYDRLTKTASTSEYKGKWNHWVFTKNATTGSMAIYLNGALWASATGKTRTFPVITSLTLGGNPNYYAGQLDDIRIYNVALDLAAVQSLYASYPTFTAQPVNQVVTLGQSATFSVTVTGTPVPTCQWLKDGIAIAGATGTTYTTPATDLLDNGAVFTCVITNSLGSVTSAAATLTTVVVGRNTTPVRDEPLLVRQPATGDGNRYATASVLAQGHWYLWSDY